MKPSDIMDMHLWEFNNYIIGYRKKIRREQENIVTLAHTTASFVNSSKRLKPLQKYLEKIAKNFEKKPTNKNKVDVEKANQIESIIARLKKLKEGEQK